MVIIKHKYYGTQTKPYIWIWLNASLEVWTHALWSSKNHTLNEKSTPLIELFLWNFQIHKTARNIINVEIPKCTKHWCSFWRQNKTNKIRAIPGSWGSACLWHCRRLVAWHQQCSSSFLWNKPFQVGWFGEKTVMNENGCSRPAIHMKHRRMFGVWYREFYSSGVRLLKPIQQVAPIAKENN